MHCSQVTMSLATLSLMVIKKLLSQVIMGLATLSLMVIEKLLSAAGRVACAVYAVHTLSSWVRVYWPVTETPASGQVIACSVSLMSIQARGGHWIPRK